MDRINVTRALDESGSIKGKKAMKLGVTLVVVLLLIVLALSFGAMAKNKMVKKENFSTDIKKNQYQAVFLTNGQVYFGKIVAINKENLKLTDIYYLQVQQQSVQPDTTKKTDANQNLSLAKLGSELHGPEDNMFVESKQMLFWENLKDDSQVVKAIKQNQQK